MLVEEILKTDKSFTNVAVVHCETSSGVINPIKEIGQVVKTELPGLNLTSHKVGLISHTN